MDMPDPPHPLTLTHARLRRAQGDARGAIAIVEAMIDAGGQDDELVELYIALGGDKHRAHQEPELPCEEAPLPTAVETLRRDFRRELGRETGAARVRRLERWLARVQRENR